MLLNKLCAKQQKNLFYVLLAVLNSTKFFYQI